MMKDCFPYKTGKQRCLLLIVLFNIVPEALIPINLYTRIHPNLWQNFTSKKLKIFKTRKQINYPFSFILLVFPNELKRYRE